MEKLFNGKLKKQYLEHLIYKIKDDVFNYFLKSKNNSFSYGEYEEMVSAASEKYYIHVHFDKVEIERFKHATVSLEEAKEMGMGFHHYRIYSYPFTGNIELLSHTDLNSHSYFFVDCQYDNRAIYLSIALPMEDSYKTIEQAIINKIKEFNTKTLFNITELNNIINQQSNSLKNKADYRSMKKMIESELAIAAKIKGLQT